MTRRFWLLIVFLFSFTGAAFAGGDDVPAWLRQAADLKSPTYPADVPAVVLLDDERVTVTEDGRLVTTKQYAIRVLTREGRKRAYGIARYETDGSTKIRDFRGWLLRPNGVRKFEKGDITEQARMDFTLYNETRFKIIDAENETDTGTVFGYESVIEERTIFTQLLNHFQNELPVLLSRYSLTLPAGWRAESVTFNHAKIEPVVAGGTYTWELRDLPPIADEPDQPKMTHLVPRVGISFYPPSGIRSSDFQTFSNWAEIASWSANLSEPRATASPAITAKTKELTANEKEEFGRLNAVGKFVQNIKYIAISTNLNRGEGLIPRPAAAVFDRAYGDCKDKANLMRTMLRTIGVNAYLISIYSGDPKFVQPEWASPAQFNHCIIAIEVSDAVQSPMIVKHPKLGRLLIFDPTDPYTPLGDLPDHEQNSFALIEASANGDLIRVPQNAPEANLDTLTVEAEVMPDGSIKAKLSNEMTGHVGSRVRGYRAELPAAEFEKYIHRWLARSATGMQVAGLTFKDDRDQGRFRVEADLAVPNYAQLMQGRLMMINPSLIERRSQVSVLQPTRRTPLEIEAESYTETLKFKLPAGFAMDELPENLTLESAYGTYLMKCEATPTEVIITRRLKLLPAVIPPEDYAGVRKFFGQIGAAEQTPIVLVKK